MTEYKYATGKDGNQDYVEVERVGRFDLNEGENAEQKVKDLIASTQNEDPEQVELKKVDDLATGVITSDDATLKGADKRKPNKFNR